LAFHFILPTKFQTKGRKKEILFDQVVMTMMTKTATRPQKVKDHSFNDDVQKLLIVLCGMFVKKRTSSPHHHHHDHHLGFFIPFLSSSFCVGD